MNTDTKTALALHETAASVLQSHYVRHIYIGDNAAKGIQNLASPAARLGVS